MKQKFVSARVRFLYTSLLLILGLVVVYGPAQAGSITITSTGSGISQAGNIFDTDSVQSTDGFPAKLAWSGGAVTCSSGAGNCSETLNFNGFFAGVSLNDLFSLGLDGTLTGGSSVNPVQITIGLTATLFNQTLNIAPTLFSNIGGSTPFSLSTAQVLLNTGIGSNNLSGTFTITGMTQQATLNLPGSAAAFVGGAAGTPEPATAGLIGLGLGGMIIAIRKRRCA